MSVVSSKHACLFAPPPSARPITPLKQKNALQMRSLFTLFKCWNQPKRRRSLEWLIKPRRSICRRLILENQQRSCSRVDASLHIFMLVIVVNEEALKAVQNQEKLIKRAEIKQRRPSSISCEGAVLIIQL